MTSLSLTKYIYFCASYIYSYWDSSYDDDLLEDRIAMNLLYVQAVSDVERGWTVASKDQQKQLDALKQRGSKKEVPRNYTLPIIQSL